MTSALVILKEPENAAMPFARRLKAVAPDLVVRQVRDAAAARAYLPESEILITLGVHLGDDAAEVFDQAPRLKWVQLIGTGVDNVVGNPSLRGDVAVTNVRGVHGAQMSEAAMAAMLAMARGLPRILRNQQAHAWERFPARLLCGKTVGVLGLGAIAESLAPICKAFGMTVVGMTSVERSVPGYDRIYTRDRLEEMAGAVDYLVVLTPYTAATHGLVGPEVLAAMKPGACIVNLARGGVVDEAALLHALDHGPLGGAALDVFATEPLPGDSPFWDHPKVVVTPHLGGFHEGYADQVLGIVEDNVRRYLAGGPSALINRV
jgi:D-2-hydroxyacid dehydrogenase (NADP+)